MRKKQRAITDPRQLEALLKRGRVCHLAMFGPDGAPYAVPVNYGYAENALYIHGAGQGTKVECLRADARVAFSILIEEKLIQREHTGDACGFTTHFVSLCGRGRAVFVEDEADKIAALDKLMAHYGPGPWTYKPEALALTLVARIDIEELIGKRNPAATARS